MSRRLTPFYMIVLATIVSSALADESPKVYIAAERPTWNYRYLANTLAQDPEFESTAMLADARGAIGADLENYSVLILVDVSTRLFRRQPEFVTQVTDFVAAGGALVFMPNESWLVEEHPLSAVLPITGGKPDELEENDAPALSRPSITGDGLRSPILRFEDDPMRNQQLWREELGASFGAPLPMAPRADALVLAVDPKRRLGGEPIPLIAVGQHGEGRVIFLNNSQTWRWRTKPLGNYHGRFWKQLTRFAAGEIKE